MKKKILALLLVLVMAVCVLPVSAFAEGVSVFAVEIEGSSGVTYRIEYADQTTWVGWRFCTSGNPVKVAQAYLYEDGQFSEQSEIDSYFGDRTEAAIRGYQYDHGLSSDGVVGEKTWRDMAFVRFHTDIAYLL